jgi:hypothetical protein
VTDFYKPAAIRGATMVSHEALSRTALVTASWHVDEVMGV